MQVIFADVVNKYLIPCLLQIFLRTYSQVHSRYQSLPFECCIRLQMDTYLAHRAELKDWDLKLDLNDSKANHPFISTRILQKAVKNIESFTLVLVLPGHQEADLKTKTTKAYALYRDFKGRNILWELNVYNCPEWLTILAFWPNSWQRVQERILSIIIFIYCRTSLLQSSCLYIYLW